MKQNTILLLILALFSFSCFDKDNDPAPVLTNGTYVGEFEQTGSPHNSGKANVTLILDGGSFSGSSDKLKFPAIGRGTFSVKGNSVDFANASFFTADFDRTLILDDTYAISTSANGVITLTHQQGPVIVVYRLKKQEEK